MPAIRRRAVLALPLLALPFLPVARPASAQAADQNRAAVVRDVETYLNSITTLQARFTQFSPDGSQVTGTLYLDRTRGGMRFDYDPPSKILLIATDWRLIYADSSIKQVNVIPLSQTPVSFLLEQNVKLSGDITLTRVEEGDGKITLGIARTANPDQGRLIATFTTRPMALRNWTVIDAQGLRTEIVLKDVRTGMDLPSKLFVWHDPRQFGWPK